MRRGSLVESTHRVSAAVVNAAGELIAGTGAPDLVTYWRSSAKPFQALPLLQDGAADRFELTDEELAIACASHSSEPFHLALVDRFLAKVGLRESDLACGPHVPLGPETSKEVVCNGTAMTPKWSNCSGKHTGMLTLAKHHGWPLAGYQRAGHPAQARILAEVSRWTGLAENQVIQGIDGCTTVCFALPLRAMATSYARFGASTDPEARRLWRAITEHPDLIAGTKRLCTDLMRLWPGELFAKVGAEGVYCAAIPSLKLGIAIKVADGDLRSVGMALIAILKQVLAEAGEATEVLARLETLADYAEAVVETTRGEAVGTVKPQGQLEFFGLPIR